MSNFIEEMNNGDWDEDLSRIESAISARRSLLSAIKLDDFRVGDVVSFNSSTNPKYLIGKRAVVVKINQKRVVVDLVYPRGRFSKNITCPTDILDKLVEEV